MGPVEQRPRSVLGGPAASREPGTRYVPQLPLTRREAATARLTADGVRSAWDDLAGDAARAYRAVAALAAAPDQAVPFLAERLKPAAAPDPKRVAALLAGLDRQRFADREEATRELEKLGGLVEPAVRRTLADKPSAEVKRRLEGLLEKMDAVTPTPGEVRAVRAVEVLEHVGTLAARRLLADLAGGVPEARQTREAREALRRLERSGSAKEPGEGKGR
jgi:hypothetical protein